MSTAVRNHQGTDLPTPGRWALDPGHAEVAFIGRHFGLTRVRGRFVGVTGHVDVAENPEQSTVEVTIDMASVNSGDTARDEHLRSDDLFDVAAHPEARFRSTDVRVDGPRGKVTGNLTIRDITRPVTLDATFVGHATDPWGGERAVFSATTTINREDWGRTWNMFLEAGGLVVSKEIRIEVEAEFIREA